MKKLAKSYTIHVTAKDIEAGRRQAWSSSACPIALALARKFKSTLRAGYSGAYVTHPGAHETRYYYYPVKAKVFQNVLFKDKNAKVKPFTFVMREESYEKVG